MRRTMRKRLARPDRVDVVTRTMVVTRTIVNVKAAKCKSQQSSHWVNFYSGIFLDYSNYSPG
jgi:hypothetical protein